MHHIRFPISAKIKSDIGQLVAKYHTHTSTVDYDKLGLIIGHHGGWILVMWAGSMDCFLVPYTTLAILSGIDD